MDTVDLALAYEDRLSLAAPLPEDMDRLLWLANGSPEILDAAVRQTGAKPGELRDAARFCIQQWCLARGVRFVYASSAATYGDGSQGYSDADTATPTLMPPSSKMRLSSWPGSLAPLASRRLAAKVG